MIHSPVRSGWLGPLALVIALASGGLAGPIAWAVQPDEILPDPALEERARDISQGLRCVVCQSENIDESNADLARDMRKRVRQLLTEGHSNDEVVDFMVQRYGDYVLMKPPFKFSTVALWLAPALLLGVGAGAVVLYFRRRATEPAAAVAVDLSDEERRRLARLLEDQAPPTDKETPA
ncbi:cytochrome c-type biogenesis protein [Pararhodospirillum oryzae]|uniref:Cytochrome c-type biogenesis protein n=1 Tax=Pararhodospirillum oryzae TaxID=478448 RepID=A0A512H6F7_9PROT|nr:cytochrome c-type biogenesis protein [Pararhodospirillum oryzae]GEO81046.1 cytochrome c biogenesis protein [Pararhodospirillum oryzae]